ncbi:hypothetical protein CRYUN_Cryun30bG0100500 [Craigia yunnanensis]
MPTRITLLSLLLSSESQKTALLKVLNEAYVPYDISVVKIDQLMGNIATNNHINFTDDEILLKERGSNKALYIIIKHKNHILP